MITSSANDNQSAMIIEMERKLNPSQYYRRYWKRDMYCKLTVTQYWDWLAYLDVILLLLNE